MSQESSKWLNTKTLIGFALKRGTAWHYRKEDQGVESNHYDGAIPVEDVSRRLFNFTVEEQPIYVANNSLASDLGNIQPRFSQVADRKAMVCSDNGDVLGIFKSGYQGHDYNEWLIENVATILGDDLGIGSAGLLKKRGQAWVSVEVPESITTPEGVVFRPNLVACTSYDGSLSTTYKRTVTAVVCDNTLSAGLGEDGQQYKLKHSRFSNMKLQDARDALAVVFTMADDFAAEVARLTSWKVSEEQFLKLVKNVMVPVGEDASKRAKTMGENKQTQIINLYRTDLRAAPWQGTAFGVLQAFNTYNHHYATQKGADSRVVRNMENVVNGRMGKLDQDVLDKLALVTA